jgi:hypothetical protein
MNGPRPVCVRSLVFENHAGIVVGSPSAVIVACRGTEEIRDWITNLAVWTVSPWPNLGPRPFEFLAAVEALGPQVQAAINASRGRSQPVWFTGHTLGGAMAVLGAVKMSLEVPERSWRRQNTARGALKGSPARQLFNHVRGRGGQLNR